MRPKLGKNSQQWIFDYVIKTTGRASNFELDAMVDKFPSEVKSWEMIPKFLEKQANREVELARRAEGAGHIRTAWEAYSKACQTLFGAQHAICEDDNPRKIQLYDRLLSCHEKIRQYSEYPIEKLEIPWGDKTVPALLHLVPDRKKAPCVLIVYGMDRSKETFPHQPGIVLDNPFLKRGMHVLAIDGPGQGECNLRKIRVRPNNHKEAGKAVIDYLMTRPEIDGDKIAIYGRSMGSYWVPHIVANDNRVKACAVAMACFMMDRHAIFEEASPRFRLTYKYMAGIEDDAEFDEMVSRMTLRGVGAKIKCPILVWTGEFDSLCPLEETDAFFNEIAGPKEMWVFEDDFHGFNSRGICNMPMDTMIADWLKDKLEGKYPPDLARRQMVPVNGAGPIIS